MQVGKVARRNVGTLLGCLLSYSRYRYTCIDTYSNTYAITKLWSYLQKCTRCKEEERLRDACDLCDQHSYCCSGRLEIWPGLRAAFGSVKEQARITLLWGNNMSTFWESRDQVSRANWYEKRFLRISMDFPNSNCWWKSRSWLISHTKKCSTQTSGYRWLPEPNKVKRPCSL